MRYYSDYTIQYVRDICKALNEKGFTMHEIPTDKPFAPQNFDTLTEFLQRFIVKPFGIYTFLNDKGLVNRGKCPYTGQPIDKTYYWSFMKSRWIYFSSEGEKIMKREHDEIHIKLFGVPRPRKEERVQMSVSWTNRLARLLNLIFISFLFFGISGCIWLGVIGQWRIILNGLILGFIMFTANLIILLPTMLLQSLMTYTERINKIHLASVFGYVHILYFNAAIVFGVLLSFFILTQEVVSPSFIHVVFGMKHQNDVTFYNQPLNFIPLLLMGYSIVLGPFLNMASKDPPESFTTIGNMFGMILVIISYVSLVVMWLTGCFTVHNALFYLAIVAFIFSGLNLAAARFRVGL